jgi:hypothetical protein
LGLKSGQLICLVHAPANYRQLFQHWPDNLKMIGLEQAAPGSIDFIHAFYTRREWLENEVGSLKLLLSRTGLLWISWPKGKSSVETDLNREIVRATLLATGLVDVKVAAIDADWSALRFVYRREDR